MLLGVYWRVMIDYSIYVREGTNRCDLSVLFRDAHAFRSAITEMTTPFRSENVTAVAGLDALGFILGTAIALDLGIGFIAVRKAGKLSVPRESIDFVDYSKQTKTFEIATEVLKAGDRILVVDEWSETGSQLKAATRLIERMNGVIAGISCFKMDDLIKSDPALVKYKLHSLITDF